MRPQSASIAFQGGGVVLAAQTPYDRELLVDYVLDCARTKRNIRITMGRAQWRVERVRQEHPHVCRQCHRPIHAARCYDPHNHKVECIACVLREIAHTSVVALPHTTHH